MVDKKIDLITSIIGLITSILVLMAIRSKK